MLWIGAVVNLMLCRADEYPAQNRTVREPYVRMSELKREREKDELNDVEPEHRWQIDLVSRGRSVSSGPDASDECRNDGVDQIFYRVRSIHRHRRKHFR